MLNTATTKEMERLKALLKEKEIKTKTAGGEKTEKVKKAPQFIKIQISQQGDVISDYTHNDDYKELLALLGAMGIKPNVQTESWCG